MSNLIFMQKLFCTWPVFWKWSHRHNKPSSQSFSKDGVHNQHRTFWLVMPQEQPLNNTWAHISSISSSVQSITHIIGIPDASGATSPQRQSYSSKVLSLNVFNNLAETDNEQPIILTKISKSNINSW